LSINLTILKNALLFSSGLDSIVSYITHKDEHPILITLLKPGKSSDNKEYHNQIRNFHKKFAEHEGIDIHFIESKMLDQLSDVLKNQFLAREFNVNNWWGGVSHGLILLGFCAPLTVEDIGTVILASSYAKKMRIPHGSHYFAFTNISWGDVKVFYDASDYSSQLKINFASVLMGGHVRVGLEDNLYYDQEKTQLATNEMLISRVAKFAREIGREVATAKQARDMLGINQN